MHAFVSYSRLDSDYVKKLVTFLRDQGLDVWVDGDVDYGDRWSTVIRTKIAGCAAFVVVMTPNGAESEWVEREIALAERTRKPILPLLLDGEPFWRLSSIHHEDVTGGRMPGRGYVLKLRTHLRSASPPPKKEIPPGRWWSRAADPWTFVAAAGAGLVVDLVATVFGGTPQVAATAATVTAVVVLVTAVAASLLTRR